MNLLGRMAMPAALLLACLVVWFLSARLGDLKVEPAAAAAVDTLDTPLASVRRLPAIATTSLRDQRIELALAALPEPNAPLSCITVMVDGERVFELRGDAPLVPGYAQLLLTGHVALDVLGPTHRFETRVMAADPPNDDGLIGASLYVIGSGDPVLMSFNYAQGFRPVLSTRTSIEALADAVVEAGVTSIGSSVVGVERRYDTQRVLPGWPAIYAESGLVGPLSALQLDDGFAERAAANLGVAISSEDPAAMTAARFDDLLEDRGVTISGLSRSEEQDEELPDLVPIATAFSAPLSDIVFQTFAVNDASAAEMLMKELGVQFRQIGSTQAGADAIQFTLAQQGVELAIPPRDGSGLDPVSTLTCNLLAETAASIPVDHPTLSVLPTHDLPGVYDGAFSEIPVDSDLRLIGGQVGDVASLVSRTVGDGPEIVIASIVNRAGGPRTIDTDFHASLVEQVDVLRDAWLDQVLEGQN